MKDTNMKKLMLFISLTTLLSACTGYSSEPQLNRLKESLKTATRLRDSFVGHKRAGMRGLIIDGLIDRHEQEVITLLLKINELERSFGHSSK